MRVVSAGNQLGSTAIGAPDLRRSGTAGWNSLFQLSCESRVAAVAGPGGTLRECGGMELEHIPGGDDRGSGTGRNRVRDFERATRGVCTGGGGFVRVGHHDDAYHAAGERKIVETADQPGNRACRFQIYLGQEGRAGIDLVGYVCGVAGRSGCAVASVRAGDSAYRSVGLGSAAQRAGGGSGADGDRGGAPSDQTARGRNNADVCGWIWSVHDTVWTVEESYRVSDCAVSDRGVRHGERDHQGNTGASSNAR